MSSQRQPEFQSQISCRLMDLQCAFVWHSSPADDQTVKNQDEQESSCRFSIRRGRRRPPTHQQFRFQRCCAHYQRYRNPSKPYMLIQLPTLHSTPLTPLSIFSNDSSAIHTGGHFWSRKYLTSALFLSSTLSLFPPHPTHHVYHLSFPPCNFMLSYRSVMSLPSYDPERQSLHITAKHPPLSHSSTSWIVNVLHRHRPAETQPHRDINNNNPNVNQLWPRADHRDVQWSRDGMHEEGGVQLHAYTVPRLGTWGPTVRPEPASLSFLMGRYCCLQADAGLAKRARKTFKLSSMSTHATHMPVLDHARLQGDRDTRSGPGWWNVRPQQPYESTLSRVAVCHRAKLSRRDSFAALRCPTLEDKPAFHGYWWSPVA
ncbi:hypothetical protein K456DRAFT_1647097 [Colletotrichum gloeosporioides 23]|nr:hypothetical protein K456DRAFT_1647097 [Colletotrichum gloeosporioides 23]